MRRHAPLCGLVIVGATGFEPATARPPAECATRLRYAPWSGKDSLQSPKRATGIEPALRAWKAPVPPQHFARIRADYRCGPGPARPCTPTRQVGGECV